MAYIENPKTKGSGILCAIPHVSRCPNKCPDCFFQSGRGYLEPLDQNLPNMPPLEMAEGRVVRVNDGHDSNIRKDMVMRSCRIYKDRFYNTAIGNVEFDAPVVITVNPGKCIDSDIIHVRPSKNIMFVRALVNSWNIALVKRIVRWHSFDYIPIVLTFMAYFETHIPAKYKDDYEFRTRTINPYWCMRPHKRESIVAMFDGNPLVHVCGGRRTDLHCKQCGNCLREYYATKERMRG